jgi:microcystin degradation protein MlrC
MRLVTGGISQETNTFAPYSTTLKDFLVIRAPAFFKHYQGKKDFIGGFINGSSKNCFELAPTIFAHGGAGGVITDTTFNALLKELLDSVRKARPYSGVVLALHGAAVSDSHDDVEGLILSEIRKIVGQNVPIVSTFDFHSNYTKLVVDNVDVLIGNDTNPHIDGYERGIEAIQIIKRLINGELRPKKAYRKLPMLAPRAPTIEHPMKQIMETVHNMENIDGIETITVAQGMEGDLEFAGMSIIVTTNDDQELADRCADELYDLAWSLRHGFLRKEVSIEKGIERVKAAKEGPIVLADTGDVAGGGGTCKGVIVLQAVLEAQLGNGVVAAIADPEAVQKAIEYGIGNMVTLKLGGKVDKYQGEPIIVNGLVKLISDGKFIRKGPMRPGSETDMGRTVVFRIGTIDTIITEKRTMPTDLQIYRSLGIEPTEKKFIVIKGHTHFLSSHGPIAKEVIHLATPGLISGDFASRVYYKLRRPIFPLDSEMM